MEIVKCDICGSEKHKIVYTIEITEKILRYYRYAQNIPNKEKMTGTHYIVKCNNCDLMFTNPRFSTDELNLIYSSNSIIGTEWTNFWHLFNSKLPDVVTKKTGAYNSNLYQWKFDIINQYLQKSEKKTKLLDIGCGDGKFVYDSIQRGIDTVGIDLSPERIANGRKLYGLNEEQLKCMNVDDFSSDETFDVIVMWDVIEHVESPTEVLQSLKRLCHKNTIILALTMSIDSITYKIFGKDWNYINPTQHLHYFSHSTMNKLFNKCNLKLVGIEMDNSKSRNFTHLLAIIVIGQINQFFFRIYTKGSLIKFLFRPLQKGISDERMKKRLENLYPGKYLGRYHDNFVFIGKLK